jgi:hypothetical protein
MYVQALVIRFRVKFRLKISYDINKLLKANNAVGTFFFSTFQRFQSATD